MGDSATQIRHAVEALSASPQNQGRRLRELLDESPAVFRQVVTAMLTSARDTPEVRYVIALLSARGLLIPMLRDLAQTDRGAAGVVAQMAQRMDPRFDRALELQGSDPRPPGAPPKPDPEFLLGLLDALSGGLCLLPMLDPLRHSEDPIRARTRGSPLRHSEDPRVRARMALLLGRFTCAQNWYQALEEDPDPRVRANAMEAFWSMGAETSSERLERGLKDPSPRVCANSLVGLYLQGMTSAVIGMVKMAESPDAESRSSAAWAMGRTGDTRFLQLLHQMRRSLNQDSEVVCNALQAIGRINHATVAASRVEARVTCLRSQTGPDSTLDAVVAIHAGESGPLPAPKPTDWQIRVNGQNAWSYQAEPAAGAKSLTLGFALPSAPIEDAARRPQMEAALRAARNWCRPNDRFSVALYSEWEDTPRPNQPAGSAKTGGQVRSTPAQKPHTDPMAALAAASLAPHAACALHRLAALLESASGDTHLLLVLDAASESSCDLAALPGLADRLRQRNIRFHSLITSSATDPRTGAFQQLSLQTGGFSLPCPDPDDLAGVLQTLVAATFGSYHLRCPLPESVEKVEMEWQADGHAGKLRIDAGALAPSSKTAA